jgi:hypothetical protein
LNDAFLSSIDAIKDAYNAQKEAYELIDKQLKHDIKLTELIYGS